MAKQVKMVPADDAQDVAPAKASKKAKSKVNMIIKSGKQLVIGEEVELTDEEVMDIKKFHPIENILE